jgi:Asp-tRNA(Asn)/Glu-tRNA(Gln) amidotransferase A subunit family amidase
MMQGKAFPSGVQDQGWLELCVGQGGRRCEQYHQAVAKLDEIALAFEAFLDEKGLDSLVFPILTPAPAIAAAGGFPTVSHLSAELRLRGGSFRQCTVPYKLLSNGEPVGLQFVARKGDDEVLIRLM